MCHYCRRYVRQLGALVTSLHKPAAPPASDEQVDRIMRNLDQAP